MAAEREVAGLLAQAAASRERREYAAARDWATRALEAAGEEPGPGSDSLVELGRILALDGEPAEAATLYRTALALRERQEDQAGVAAVRSLLGRLAAALGDLDSAREELRKALTIQRRGGDHAELAATLARLAQVEIRLSEFASAARRLREAAVLVRRLGDRRGQAGVMANQAFLAYLSGDMALAEARFSRVLALRRELGDPRGVAMALAGLANALLLRREADLLRAEATAEEAVAAAESAGDLGSQAWAAYVLGEVARARGDWDRATARAEDSLALYRRAGRELDTGLPYLTLAQVALAEGDPTAAQPLAHQALRLAQRSGLYTQEVRALECAARIAAAGQDWSRVALLLGAARFHRTRAGMGTPARPELAEALAQAGADVAIALGPETAESWLARGGELSMDQAVEVALAPAGSAGAAGEAFTGEGEEIPPGPYWSIQVLGDFTVRAGGRVVSLPAGAASQVVKMLATLGPLHVEELAELVWQDEGPGVARRRLNNVMTRLRRSAAGLVVRQGDTVRLAPGSSVDARRFASLARRALDHSGPGGGRAEAMAALGSYAGELLPTDRYVSWPEAARRRLAVLHLRLLDETAESAAAAGEVRTAVDLLEQAIASDPLGEQRHLRVIELLQSQGWHSQAAVAARRLNDIRRALGVA